MPSQRADQKQKRGSAPNASDARRDAALARILDGMSGAFGDFLRSQVPQAPAPQVPPAPPQTPQPQAPAPMPAMPPGGAMPPGMGPVGPGAPGLPAVPQAGGGDFLTWLASVLAAPQGGMGAGMPGPQGPGY